MPPASSLRALRPSEQVLLPRHTIYTTSLRCWKHPLHLSLLHGYCCLLSTSARSFSYYRRFDFTGQPYTGIVDTNAPTRGPLSTAATNVVPKVLPRDLKRHLDKYVVGQERAKVVLSTAFFYHNQGVLRRKRIQEEERKRLAKIEREEAFEREPINSFDESSEREYNGNFSPTRSLRLDRYQDRRSAPPTPAEASQQIKIQKSNVLMLGPTGVGKTLIVETLVREIDVPYAICDCTSMTQAGYIGEDVESSVHRLLVAADYDPVRAENGIIIFDEVDKIATAKVPNGKDVSGEGVQQSLLKLIEGTTLQINVKQPKSSNRSPPGGGGSPPSSSNPFPKEETYTINTENILFIFAGAFVGLEKIVRNRISKSSIGFGSPISSNSKITPSKSEAALIRKHLPYFTPSTDENLTVLDIVDPEDLRQFGFIPEFIGRIPKITALTHLSVDDLMRILTDTEDCKVKQYTTLFQESSGVELRFTMPALEIIAQKALDKGTGARGLVSVLENLLQQAMYETPTRSRSIQYVLVNRKVANLECKPRYFTQAEHKEFLECIRLETEEWEAQKAREKGEVVPEVQHHGVFEAPKQQVAGKARM